MNLNKVILLLFLTLPVAIYAKQPLPDWTKGAVWYLILPERFRNINPANDPVREQVVADTRGDWQTHPWASDWYKLQVWEEDASRPFEQTLLERRYGGDLVGVFEKLLYLKDLGVDVINLTPIFESPSIEKYDASTLHHVDNNFGLNGEEDGDAIASETDKPDSWTLTKSDELFGELLRQTHESEMRIVIEAQFNYCGREFWAFKDVEKYQKESAYKDWFEILNWDDPLTPDTLEFSYKSWQGDTKLPLFKRDARGFLPEAVKDYIFNSTRRWMDLDGDGATSDGVDGWALRHVEELPAGFWREWNELVRSLNEEAITISDFSKAPQEVLDRYDFSLVKSDKQSRLMIEFFVSRRGEMPLSDFTAKMRDLSGGMPEDAKFSTINQLGDQTKPRIASVILNARAQRGDSHAGANGNGHAFLPFKPDSNDRKIQNLLTVFQLTYPGSPMIYYGDESGMWGGYYPDNIKPMLWKEFVYEKETYRTLRPEFKGYSVNAFEPRIFNTYRKLNRLRLKSEVLRLGDYKEHLVDEEKKLFVYSRDYKDDEVWVFMNLGDAQQSLEITPGWKKNLKVVDPFQREKYRLDKFDIKLTLPALSSRVLVKE